MHIRHTLRWLSVAAIGALASCGGESAAPVNNPPAALNASTDLTRTAVVGSALTDAVVVKVTDASGNPVRNASVALSVTQGNGTVEPRVATTDSKGQATASWTLGTVVGLNEVTASVSGVATLIRFQATGTPGPVTNIVFTPANARILATADSVKVTAQGLDAFGNATTPAPTLVIRDPTLVVMQANGWVKQLRRGSATYIVATAGAKTDSVLVTVLAPGQSPCTAAATPVELVPGQVITNVPGSGFCVHASSANAEYTLIPYFNAGVPNASVNISVLGQGVSPVVIPTLDIFRSTNAVPQVPAIVKDEAFEARMRAQERSEITSRVGSARAWYGARKNSIANNATAPAPIVVPAEGTLLKVNTNALDYCDKPDIRTGRVVAVTDKAIVVADTANPIGGFTDAEYRSIGVTFDTLVDPVDRAAFGAATDIDNNGHVILFFTRAVNELTSPGASSVVLGFFYGRDLLPKTVAPGPCSGSNVGEMFYLIVPDTSGVVNSNKRPKSQVVSFSNGTVAHEYQHLINASRRLYVNGAGTVTEEKWLDEGLAHTAEELNFFRAAGRVPRSNLDATAWNDPKFPAAFSTFDQNNFRRYETYLTRTESQAPVGSDIFDDDLYTRGAIWDFLRFAADHLPAGQEDAFWFKLVNSTSSGIANLTNALGAPPNSLFRDWAISVYLDDHAPNVDPRFQQPSWNMPSAVQFSTALPFPIVLRSLSDNVTSGVTLAAGGASYLRFSIPVGQDALVTVSSSGQAIPATVQLSLVRVR